MSTRVGVCLARAAIFRCFVEMGSRLKVRGICPSGSSVHRPPPSLHGVPWGRFPRFSGTMQRLRRLVSPPRFVAFARRFHPDASSFAPCEHGRHAPKARTISSAAPVDRFSRMESTRPPRFLGNPYGHAQLFDPGGPAGPRQRGTPGVAFRSMDSVGSAIRFLSGLHHAAYTFPVYASQPGSHPDHATLGYRLVASLYRGRTFTCWVPSGGFRHVGRTTWLPPPPGLTWRNHCRIVSCDTMMPRSASRSSTSRKLRPKRW